MALPALTTIPDIVGTGKTAELAKSGVARWILFSAPAANKSNCRYGDILTGVSRGGLIRPNQDVGLPALALDVRIPSINSYYQLNSIYVYVPAGDSLGVVWSN